MKKTRCSSCHKYFYMGYNGTVDGCDKCTGTVRDSHGRAWAPGENSHTYMSVATHEISTVSRRKALNPK